jgi:acyl dehydratase
MAIDPKRALGADLGSIEASWDPDRIILYHLGLGAGVPQTDPGELEYTYEKNLKVLPSYGVIPAFPALSGLARVPGMQFNFAMLLHGEQDLEIRKAIPTRARVVTTGRVAGLYDKGKAALAVLETETRDESGDVLFVNRFSLFLRGEGGFGGEPGPRAGNQPPERAPDRVVESPTLPQQALLYRLSGDKNPLHADPEFSKMGGFETPILHGLCSYGIACKAVVDGVCGGETGRVARYQARFAGVAFPGETLVTSMWREGERVLLATSSKQRNAPVISNAAITLR